MERGREHFFVEATLYEELFWKSQPVIYISLANPIAGGNEEHFQSCAHGCTTNTGVVLKGRRREWILDRLRGASFLTRTLKEVPQASSVFLGPYLLCSQH